MSEEMRTGMLLAYQSVKKEMETIKVELSRKGFDEPKGFSVLKGFVQDRMKDIEYEKENN